MKFEVKVKVEVDREMILCMLIGAFEGGSTYWMEDFCLVETKRVNAVDFYDSALDKGVWIKDIDGKRLKLNRRRVQKGLKTFALTRHFSDMMDEMDDCETADAFLQHCLYGEMVYG